MFHIDVTIRATQFDPVRPATDIGKLVVKLRRPMTDANSLPRVPGSRYLAELNRPSQMRFPPDLEAEYRKFYLAERRSHVRSFNVIMLGLVLLGLAASLWSKPIVAGAAEHIRMGLVGLAYVVMIWAAYTRSYERVYLKTAFIASTLVALVGAVEVAYRIHAGSGEMFAVLTAYSIGMYFLAGILYHGALLANSLMVFALATTLVLLEVPPGKIAYLTAILATTVTIGGIAFRHMGTRFRRTFLERGLITEMAARDGLTGLKNRRAFDEHLVRIWQQALRDRRPLVVMLIDVDHFKKYNDRYGHQAGDEALQRVATVVDEFAQRPLDLAARFGGEEFAIILYDLARHHIQNFTDQLRASIETLDIEHADVARGVATVSIGVAVVQPRLERSPEGAVQLADEALYRAKRDGRNRAVIYEHEYDVLATGIFNKR